MLNTVQTNLEDEKDDSGGDNPHDDKQKNLQAFFMIFLTLLMIYTILGLYMEKKKPIIGHETGIIIVLGMIISFIFRATEGSENKVLEFDGVVFFDLCLPLIIFASGYNLKRKKFFQNFNNVTKFGLFGTVITFILYASMTSIMFQMFKFEKFYPVDSTDGTIQAGETRPLKFGAVEILFSSSLFTSSDIIAAITIVKFEEFPKLFSIILGEGLANDAVAIILFDTMGRFEFDSKESFTATTPFVVLWQFVTLLIMSTAIGLLFGFTTSYMTKRFRFIS